MPIDYPSQAQVGLGKGIEGFFQGLQKGNADAEKQAYLNALLKAKMTPKAPAEKTVRMIYEGLGKRGATGQLPSIGKDILSRAHRLAFGQAIGYSPSGDSLSALEISRMTPEQQESYSNIFKTVIEQERALANADRQAKGMPLYPATAIPDVFEYATETQEPGMLGSLFGAEPTQSTSIKGFNPAFSSMDWLQDPMAKRPVAAPRSQPKKPAAPGAAPAAGGFSFKPKQ